MTGRRYVRCASMVLNRRCALNATKHVARMTNYSLVCFLVKKNNQGVPHKGLRGGWEGAYRNKVASKIVAIKLGAIHLM